MEKTLLDLFNGKTTEGNIQDGYDNVAKYYDEILLANFNMQSHCEAAKVALRYSPGVPCNMRVLEVGIGTGLVGKELKTLGFENVDGIEPSRSCLEIAATRGWYKKLICKKFTKTPLDIPESTYDMIVTCGTFLKGHLPYDCIIEMIRLVKPGGRICIISRSESFDGKTIPEYKDLVPFMQELEASGKWKKLEWNVLPNYTEYIQGHGIVYEVL